MNHQKTPAVGKYARVERERRFLFAEPPAPAVVTVTRRIDDRYLTGTRLRLRRVERTDSGAVELKLTQKLPGTPWGLVTNTYLSPEEYRLLATLPAQVIRKTRYSVPPLGIDVFEPPLHGLVLAEAEFDTEEEARVFAPPAGCVAEVTADPRFTGGSLVSASRAQLRARLAEYGIQIE
ncbi:CYTH domain-containing protein [Kitasatospora azatica]|uniref:hypothetical protein n=1 Tax=Kitasatospora azatica TaxID=58347 RepID=UPI00056C15D4|nr:hypothetical protein [Kitasatospora azatica]